MTTIPFETQRRTNLQNIFNIFEIPSDAQEEIKERVKEAYISDDIILHILPNEGEETMYQLEVDEDNQIIGINSSYEGDFIKLFSSHQDTQITFMNDYSFYDTERLMHINHLVKHLLLGK